MVAGAIEMVLDGGTSEWRGGVGALHGSKGAVECVKAWSGEALYMHDGLDGENRQDRERVDHRAS